MSAPETVSPADAAETDITDITGKTDLVGNGDFLLAVFGELVDARPVVVSFEGNPASVPAKASVPVLPSPYMALPSHALIVGAGSCTAASKDFSHSTSARRSASIFGIIPAPRTASRPRNAAEPTPRYAPSASFPAALAVCPAIS